MGWSVLLCALAAAACAECRFAVIEKEVIQYFNSENMKSFEEQWEKMRLPIQSAIRQSLINMYGRGEMNVFIKSKGVKMVLTRGFLVTDNVVQVLIVNPTMREVPMILAPEIYLTLAGNAMRIEGGLSKIFIDAEYLLFRNHTAIEYTNLDPEKVSPFSFHQVQDVGSLAITAEGCNFLGSGMASLLGSSVNLGYNTFRVQDCKFNIEISTEGLGTPPVMAPYFNKEQSRQLEILMSKVIRDEMNTKIQSALLSYVNTTAIFGLKKQPLYIYEQKKIFRSCAKYLEKLTRNANAAMMEKNKGVLTFEDHSMTWHDKKLPNDAATTITIKDLVVSGLDTGYTTYRGGPYKIKNFTTIAEDFYFHTLHLQGVFVLENGTKKVEYDFGGEVPDVHISVKVDIAEIESKENEKEQEKKMNKFRTVSAKGLQLAIPEIGTIIRERIAAHSYISGYLYNIVPKKLVEVLSEIFPKAVRLDDSRLLKYAVPGKVKDDADDGDDKDGGGNQEEEAGEPQEEGPPQEEQDPQEEENPKEEDDNEVAEPMRKGKKYAYSVAKDQDADER